MDEQSVGGFSSDGADEPFGVRVGSRTSWWHLYDLDAGGGEGGVERGGELARGTLLPNSVMRRRPALRGGWCFAG
ncbi:hypothetical protein [Saccharothrix luteola]|uniref:hypothetical protein n=1 Tax=Saccharothrix luteola TaxID=2893018 RepID=UPI001E4A95C2|nr:hypothetical protein [Saccharothrix luteola]MCC8249746.1 hypothetical protein [Saccharothrix luteola]